MIEAVAIWAGLALVLTLAYEFVDRLWLAGRSEETVETARMVRGIAMSLTATVVTAAYLLWRRVPSLRQTLGATSPADTRPAPVPRRTLAEWLLGLRWVALLVLAAVVAGATVWTARVPPQSTAPLWLGVTVLLTVNLALTFAPRPWRARTEVLTGQVLLDVAVLAWMLHHAGGMANPFAGVFVFQGVIAAMVLEPRVARRIAFAIGLAILTLAGLEATGLAPAACLDNGSGRCVSADALHTTATGAGIAILTFGCALFVTALVQVLSRERDRLAGTEKALLEEQDKLQSIIDCMADGVIFADANGKIHLRNRASDALWGGHPPPREDLHVCHSKETWERLKEKLENAGPNEMHPILQVGPRSFEANFAQVRTGQHELRGVVMVARDVTERLQAQKWRMNKERMAVVGKLAASLAHELNNPLGSIALFTRHALKRVPEGDPMADYLGTVQTNAQQCKKIVKDLLTYARQRPPEQRLSSLHALIGDVTRTLEHEAERAGVDVHGEVVPEEESAEVYGDPDQLRQVLVNLGLNAIEAMNPAGGGTLRIGAQVCPDGAARFEVCDTGPGISDEQRENLFQAFYTTKAEGTGLGLAVAQDVIAAHGGELELESEPGSGCAFRFRLPGAIQSAPDTVQVMESSP